LRGIIKTNKNRWHDPKSSVGMATTWHRLPSWEIGFQGTMLCHKKLQLYPSPSSYITNNENSLAYRIFQSSCFITLLGKLQLFDLCTCSSTMLPTVNKNKEDVNLMFTTWRRGRTVFWTRCSN
jgi:hypothetical protein